MELRTLTDKDRRAIDEIIQETFSQRSRLKNLQMVIHPFTRYRLSAATLSFSPSLASLSFRAAGCNNMPSLDFTICSASNTLRSLDVSGDIQWILPKCMDKGLHFPSLSALSFATDITGNLDDVHTILSACPNIERMNVEARMYISSNSSQTPQYSTSSTNNIVLFPRLAHLTILIENNFAALQVVSWITCPTLRNFEVKGSILRHIHDPSDRQSTKKIVKSLGEFVERSCPPLAMLNLFIDPLLHLDQIDLYGPLIRNLLRPLRDLESLTLQGVLVDTELFEEMTLLGDEKNQFTSTICPSLSVLCINVYFPAELSAHVVPRVVEEMIRSRMNEPRKLEEVFLDVPGCRKYIWTKDEPFNDIQL